MRCILLSFGVLCCGSIALGVISCQVARPLDLSKPEDVAELFARRCGGCHTLPAPREYTAAEWPDVIEENASRARLTDLEQEVITKWVTAKAADAGGK